MNVQGRRKRGRPKRRWLENVKEYIRENGLSADMYERATWRHNVIVHRPHIKVGIRWRRRRRSKWEMTSWNGRVLNSMHLLCDILLGIFWQFGLFEVVGRSEGWLLWCYVRSGGGVVCGISETDDISYEGEYYWAWLGWWEKQRTGGRIGRDGYGWNL